MRFFFAAALSLLLLALPVEAQVEHIPIYHPVYDALMRWEAAHVLHADFSSSTFPLQRKEITAALRAVRAHESLLTEADNAMLVRFEREFGIVPAERSAVFRSRSDSTQVLFERVFSNDNKYLFSLRDSNYSVYVLPLFSVTTQMYAANTQGSGSAPTLQPAVMGEIGGRMAGTLTGTVGFVLQGTSGRTVGNAPAFLFDDERLSKSFNFLYDKRHFDFTESHLRFDKDWFYASIGRETRMIGSGYFMRSLYSGAAPVADAFMMGARFEGFEYRSTQFSLLGQPEPNPRSIGAGTFIPSKYMAIHRAAFRGAWGEAGVSEISIYSRRGLDMAYLLPVSFFRTITNDLRDRDNYALALDMTLRPWSGLQAKGNFIIDDMRIPELGKDWWANKFAWNIGVMIVPSTMGWSVPIDATLEYSRVEPYTFSHFDYQNAATQDGRLFAGHLQPNSDELTAQLRYWTGNRYPLALTAIWRRHGANTYDAQEQLITNVGGSALSTLRYNSNFVPIDSERVTFLGGELQQRLFLTVSYGIEIVRQWSVHTFYQFATLSTLGVVTTAHNARIQLRFEDF